MSVCRMVCSSEQSRNNFNRLWFTFWWSSKQIMFCLHIFSHSSNLPFFYNIPLVFDQNILVDVYLYNRQGFFFRYPEILYSLHISYNIPIGQIVCKKKSNKVCHSTNINIHIFTPKQNWAFYGNRNIFQYSMLFHAATKISEIDNRSMISVWSIYHSSQHENFHCKRD